MEQERYVLSAWVQESQFEGEGSSSDGFWLSSRKKSEGSESSVDQSARTSTHHWFLLDPNISLSLL